MMSHDELDSMHGCYIVWTLSGIMMSHDELDSKLVLLSGRSPFCSSLHAR